MTTNMMTNKKIKKFIEKYEVPVIIDDNKTIWFLGSKVCNLLDYESANSAIHSHVDKNNKKKFNKLRRFLIEKSQNYRSRTTFINEGGVIELITKAKAVESITMAKILGISIIKQHDKPIQAIKKENKTMISNRINKFMEKYEISIIIDDKKTRWFSGSEISNILGYERTNDFTRGEIHEDNKKRFSELQKYLIEKPPNSQPHSIYINDNGLIDAIAKSKTIESMEIAKLLDIDIYIEK